VKSGVEIIEGMGVTNAGANRLGGWLSGELVGGLKVGIGDTVTVGSAGEGWAGT
jgi:hypothetical protein